MARFRLPRRRPGKDFDPAWWVRRLSSSWLRENLERIQSTKGRDDAAGRTEFARVCYLYSCLIRGEEIGDGKGHGDGGPRGYSNIDCIVFLPLDATDRFAFVSLRPAGEDTAASFERVDIERLKEFDSWALVNATQDLVQHMTADGGAAGSEEERADLGAVRAVAVGASDRRWQLASLVELVESLTSRGPKQRLARKRITQLLLIRQTVENTPSCLIVLSRRGLGAASFEGQDAEIESATQLLFETYRVSRLTGFTDAYRELVDERLLLGAQLVNLQEVRRHLESDGRSPEPMEEFVYSFCQSLVDARALPEMDNALFFPLVGQRYYFYRPPARRGEEKAQGSLVVEDLAIDASTVDAVLANPVETRDDDQKRCRRLFAARLRHLGLVEQGTAVSNEELRESLTELTRAIREPLEESTAAAIAREGRGLFGYVDAALFSLARWRDWGFEAIARHSLDDLTGGENANEGGGNHGAAGSLLALTILFDHLPLGILFLNSGLSGAFGKEDQRDVRGIAKAYFQTFQLGELSKIVHGYQALEGQLTIEVFQRDKASAAAIDFNQSLKEYAETLFGSFPSLDACIWLALDRDAMHVFSRDPTGISEIQRSPEKALSRRLKALEKEADKEYLADRFRAGLETINGELQDERKRRAAVRTERTGHAEDEELAQRIAQNSVRWIYCWAMLRGTGAETLDRYPNLEEIPEKVLRVKTAPGALQAHLEGACFDACILDDEFPYLRRLVAADEQHRGLLQGPSGSLMVFLIFYEGLHKGILLLASNAELSFTPEIEIKDAQLATRAFLLPVQMAMREKVVREYQRLLLGEDSATQETSEAAEPGSTSPAGESSDILAFMATMLGALPTMKSGLFIPLNSDSVYSLIREGENEPTARLWWSCSNLRGYGKSEGRLRDSLSLSIDKLANERGDAYKREIRQLYLRCLRDILEGRRHPRNYSLDKLVQRIYDRDGTVAAGQGVSGLRSYSHVSCWPTCAFQADTAFPHLGAWLDLSREGSVATDALRKFWKGRGSLLAIGLLNEGLPLGIMLLGSDIPGSFGEQERLDVEAAAKVFFREGQIDYRDQVIGSYREIVRDVLSEDGMSRQIEALKNEPCYKLGDDEFGAYVAYFMEILYAAYEKDPPSDIVFFPLAGDHIYVALPAGHSGGSRPLLQRIPASSLELDAEIPWDELRKDWLRDTIAHLAQGEEALEALSGSSNSPEVALSALRERVDLCLRTTLLRGHRYAERLRDQDRGAYLAPFVDVLGERADLNWREAEAGSLLITAMLYDRLPAGGLLIMNSPIPWRFIEQDRVDVEAVAKAYFLTYRSICLKREAARAARLSGMQQVLLGVTHRLKNDLQPTYTVLSSLRRIQDEDADDIGRRVLRLQNTGQLESGTQGIEQVQKKFAMLRSIVTGGRQPKRARTLSSISDRFEKLLSVYRRRLPMLFAGFETESIELRLHEVPTELADKPELSRVVPNPDDVWIDVSDGIEEVLAIYAENAVRAVGGHGSSPRQIYFWFADTQDPSMAIYDRVVIPKEKMPYITQGEAIPTEVGGGSGTGLYNARNLLEINRDGEQTIYSHDELGGTLIRVPLARLVVQAVRVSSATVENRIRSSLSEIQAISNRRRRERDQLPDLRGFRWSFSNHLPGKEDLRMYEGSYSWEIELFPLTWQIFVQRRQNLRKQLDVSENTLRRFREAGASEVAQNRLLSRLQERQRALAGYSIAVSFREAGEGYLRIDFRDNTQTGFLNVTATHRQKAAEDALLIDQFERHHNRRSLTGPEGAVGEIFVAMRERLQRTCGILLEISEGDSRCAVITLTIPTWQEAGR